MSSLVLPPCAAVLATGPNTVELGRAQPSDPAPDEVVVQTLWTSVSAGTERQLIAGAIAIPGGPLFPYIPGYEATGRVVALGQQAPRELLGQTVFVGGSMRYEGVRALFGAQSATIVAPASRVTPLGALDPRTGLLIGLAATALHGVGRLGDLKGRSVLIIGQGAVGRLAALAARRAGAAWIGVADREPGRLAEAPGDARIVAGEEAAPGREVDLLIEASGSAPALLPYLGSLARGGTILLLGFYEALALPYMPLFLREPALIVSREWGPGDPEAARALLAASPEAARILSDDFALEDAADAFAAALGDLRCLKVAIRWPEDRR